ncbi:MAG: HD domain-containing protein [Clostridia bacterium]|nr:HD domain-containing protein [Clostridia bacterium]
MQKSCCVNELRSEQSVSEFFLVKSISIRVGSNRKMFLDLVLADSTGEINGKKWDVSDDEVNALNLIKEGDIVKVKAEVTEWNGLLQLKVTRIRKAQKEDKLEISDYIKSAPEDPMEMYTYVLTQAESISDAELKMIAVKFLSDNKEKLLYYPAAMRNHHAELGGLLYHIKRMLMTGEKACEIYGILDRDWVICGVIIHDMEKLNEIMSNEMGISPGYTFEGQMLGHLVQGVKAIDRMAKEAEISEEKAIMLEHMIISHHYEAEFGSPRKPLFPEAELLHYLDMIDAKLYDFEDALSGTPAGEFSQRVRTLDGRMLYKPTFKKDRE